MKYRNSFFYQALSLLTAVAIFHLSLTSSGYARSGMNGRGGSEGSQKRSGGRTGSGDFGLIEENLEFFTTTLSQAVLALPEEELRARLEQAPTQPGFDEIFQSVNTADLAQLIRNTRPYFGEGDHVGIDPDGECAAVPIAEAPTREKIRHFSWGCDADSGLYLAALPRWRDRSAYGEVPALLVPLKNRRSVYLSLLQEAAHTWGYPNSQARPFAESLYAALENELMQAVLTSAESSTIVVDRQLRVFYPVNDDLTGAHYSQHFYTLELPREFRDGDPVDELSFPLLRCEMRALSGQGLELTSSVAFTTYFRCKPSQKPISADSIEDWKSSERDVLNSLRKRLQASDEAFARLLEKHTLGTVELHELRERTELLQTELASLTEELMVLKQQEAAHQRLSEELSWALNATWFAFGVGTIINVKLILKDNYNYPGRNLIHSFSRHVFAAMIFVTTSYYIFFGKVERVRAYWEKVTRLKHTSANKQSELQDLLPRIQELDEQLSTLAAVLNHEVRNGVDFNDRSQTQSVIQSSIESSVRSLEWSVTSSTPAVELVPVMQGVWPKFTQFFGERFVPVERISK